MAGMPRKEVEALLKHLEKQGVTLRETKNGVMLLFPDGSTAMAHWTTSDTNAFRPLRAAVKRAGLTWPGDHSHAGVQSSPATLKAIRKAFFDNKYKPMTVAEIMKAAGITQPTISRAHSSGELVKIKRGLYKLPELLSDKSPALAVPEPEPSYPEIEKARTILTRVPLATVENKLSSQVVDFIDERDSWTVNMNGIGDLTVDQMQAVYEAAGLRVEVRVWKGIDN